VNEADILSLKQRFGIVGNSPSLNHAIEVAAQVAPTDMTVLITGESGVGKESFSKIIHQVGHRKHGQFIAVNCGAIPEGTIDSELFGHEKGSFTGAYEARKGYFEVTNGGSIFLDEIAEMPIGTQARLLRVLEYGEFIRVGSSKVQKTNVRVIAATNKNLIDQVQIGKFREDLYYRLNTVPIFVPPLRERGNDIELLFRKFASDYGEKYKTKPIFLTLEAKEKVLSYSFPGNIRQLKNIVEQISVLEMNREITLTTLAKYLPSKSSLPAVIEKSAQQNGSVGVSERDILYKVLFDLRKDLMDLKAVVYEGLNHEDADPGAMENKPQVFTAINESTSESESKKLPESQPLILDVSSETASFRTTEAEVQDISHETEEEESLSLEKKEKELIIKALQKNNNKRKYAAQDLGISERTLYRKIKQYEIGE